VSGVRPRVAREDPSDLRAFEQDHLLHQALQSRTAQATTAWTGLDDLEIATAESVDWFNHRPPFDDCDDLTPVEAEHAHYTHRQTQQPLESQTRKSPDTPGRFRLLT
jgi:hypothetical protein